MKFVCICIANELYTQNVSNLPPFFDTQYAVNNKEIYPLFARTVPDSMGESIAIVKYFCNEVNTRHLAVPHEQVSI